MNKLISPHPWRKRLAISLLAIASLTACTSGKWGFPYRAPVQQGNWITEEQVSYLQQGMSEDQVRYALGSPTLVDVFHPNHWNYHYYFKPGYGEPVLRKFSVIFDANGHVQYWEGDVQPNFQPADYATQQQWSAKDNHGNAPQSTKNAATPIPNTHNPQTHPLKQ